MTYTLFSPFEDSTDSFLTPFLNDVPENSSQMTNPIDSSRPMTYVSHFRPPAATTPRSFESLPHITVNPPFKLNRSVSAKISSISLVSPSIFYTFPESSTISLQFDVVTNDSAVSFVTQPPLSITNPRFLVYAIVHTGISPMPFKMILNGNTIIRRLNDITAVDVTNILAPFGQKNWLVVETEGIFVPFSLIGVWAQFNTVEQIVAAISARPCFQFTDITALCPITGYQIEIPAKGCHCNHENCFDLLSYLTTRQALGIWTCTICNNPLPFEDLIVGAVIHAKGETIENAWGINQDDVEYEEGSYAF